METMIGNKRLISNQTLIIPKNQQASFTVDINGQNLKVVLIFEIQVIPGQEKGASWTFDNNELKFIFKGWDNTIGTALIKPQKLGRFNNQPLSFNIAHYLIGQADLVHFQLLIGDDDE